MAQMAERRLLIRRTRVRILALALAPYEIVLMWRDSTDGDGCFVVTWSRFRLIAGAWVRGFEPTPCCSVSQYIRRIASYIYMDVNHERKDNVASPRNWIAKKALYKMIYHQETGLLRRPYTRWFVIVSFVISDHGCLFQQVDKRIVKRYLQSDL